MSDLAAHLVGGAAGGLGLLSLSQVVVNAPEQGCQPSGDDEEFAVLGEGDPSAEQAVYLGEALLGPVAQHGGRNDRIGAAEEIGGFGECFERAGSGVGRLEFLGELHGPVQIGLGPQRVYGNDAGGLDELADSASVRTESQVFRLESG